MSNLGDIAFDHIDNARLDHVEFKQTVEVARTDVLISALGALVGIGYALMDIADAARGDNP